MSSQQSASASASGSGSGQPPPDKPHAAKEKIGPPLSKKAKKEIDRVLAIVRTGLSTMTREQRRYHLRGLEDQFEARRESEVSTVTLDKSLEIINPGDEDDDDNDNQ
jgi:hypothetical protein